MNTTIKHNVFTYAWQLVKRFGFSMSEALKTAWANAKFKAEAFNRIVEFYFQKVDGSLRQAFGTLKSELIPATAGTDNRKKNEDIQVYFDTEKQAWRCFKKCNLIKVVNA